MNQLLQSLVLLGPGPLVVSKRSSNCRPISQALNLTLKLTPRVFCCSPGNTTAIVEDFVETTATPSSSSSRPPLATHHPLPIPRNLHPGPLNSSQRARLLHPNINPRYPRIPQTSLSNARRQRLQSLESRSFDDLEKQNRSASTCPSTSPSQRE